MKRYDEAYFSRWYRDPAHRVSTVQDLERKVRMAVGVAEFLLARRIRSVLDIGCGEAPWRPVLRRLRPGVRYTGVDSSDYVLRRFGKRRNIRRGSLGSLASLRLPRQTDLVVCADVIQYVPTADVERGLAEIRRLLGGVAYIETFAAEDDMEGDGEDWYNRPATAYRAMFRRARLVQCGPYCYLNPKTLRNLNAFERL